MIEKPNVVLILTDDQGWDDAGFNGNTLIETPNLDKLASDSVQFRNFYATPVCAPTRAGILTGRHYLRTGVCHVHGGRDFMHPGELTAGQWFKANGYSTGIWGKWHSGKTTGYFPWERGFDEAYMADLYKHRDSTGEFNGRSCSHKGWTVDTITDYALEFIGRKKDGPFFAFIPYLTVHEPLLCPDELVEKYRRKNASVTLATAYGMIEQLDNNIGRIMSRLAELGLDGSTIVIFLSDNGPQYFGEERMSPEDYARRYPSGMKGHKGSMWENGIRVPCLMRWKGRLEPAVKTCLADIYDILPTLVDLCGLSIEPAAALPFDGRSIRSILDGGGASSPQPKEHFIFSNVGWPPIKQADKIARIEMEEYRPVPPEERKSMPFGPQLCGLRNDELKLLRNPGFAYGAPEPLDGEVLIDMKRDRLEDHNIAGIDRDAAVRMRMKIEKWFDEVKSGPHSFHCPRFAIGPGTSSLLYFYAPLRRLGGAWNGGLASFNWTENGDGGDYLIDVRESGTYSMRLNAASLEGERKMLSFSIEGKEVCRAKIMSPKSEIGCIRLDKGLHTLRITIAGSAEDARSRLDRLISLEFSLHTVSQIRDDKLD